MRPALPVFLLGLQLGAVTAQVKIHEVVFDGVATDGDEVFTELTGPSNFSLDGWVLEGINGGTGAVYRTVRLDGITMPADGVLVLATSSALGEVLEARDVSASVDWQNGPDGLRLLNPSGLVVDALQYGDAGVHNAGEGQPALVPAAGQALSRDSLGTDTGNNLQDFTAAPPTPGVAIFARPRGATLSLPDTAGLPGQELDLALRVGDNDAGLLSVEVAVLFDAAILTPVTVVPAVSTQGWQMAANVIQGQQGRDTLRLALATDVDTLRGAAALLQLRFRVDEERSPAQAILQLAQAVIDDGTTAAVTADGGIRRIGHTAIVETDADSFALPYPLQLRVIDPDEDRTPAVDTMRVTIAEGDTLEQIALVEDDTASGSFRGTAVFRHGLPVLGDGLIQMSPRQTTSMCVVDALDGEGARTTLCRDLTALGHDGRLRITRVAEPGDTLWLRVEDPDLDRDSSLLEASVVTVQAGVDGVPQQRPVTAVTAAAAIFDAYLLSSSQDTSGGRIPVTAGDAIVVTYLDTAAAGADHVLRRDTTRIITRFGDADGNGRLQAFDANSILRHVLTPELTVAGSLAANLDSLAPEGAVTPLDASLLLRQRVGLVTRFPVQRRGAVNHPGPGTDPLPAARTTASQIALSLRVEGEDLLVWMAQRDGVLAAQFDLAGVTATEVEVLLPGYIGAHANRGGLLRVAMAGAVPVRGPGPLLRLRHAAASPAARMQQAIINDDTVTTVVYPAAAVSPRDWELLPNHPNPFNGATLIPLRLNRAARVRAQVVNTLGQQIRILWDGPLSSGLHQLAWDGCDDAGRPSATGLYTARVRVGRTEKSRRLMLLR